MKDKTLRELYDALGRIEESISESFFKKKAFKTSLKVGDIMVSSWGYDQTNIDFYQIVGVTPSGKSVKIRPIGKDYVETGMMYGNSTPIKDDFKGDAVTKKVSVNNAITFNSFRCAFPWSGTPQYESHYA